jgi:leader peptidase (prepilin peptidase)/N-methyltransferase
MLLKGFCRHCKAPIALRYPLVEAVTGLLFVLVFWQIGLSGLTLGYWCFFSWLFALALIDWDTLTLPDALTQSGLVAGLVFQLTWGFWETGHWSNAVFHVMTSVQGAVVGLWSFEILLVVATIVFRRQAMGRGDIKLAAMIGAWLGWQQIFLCLFLAAFLGSLVGLMWMGGRSGNDRSLTHSAPIPFGPFLAVASSLCALWGNDWLNHYLQLFY